MSTTREVLNVLLKDSQKTTIMFVGGYIDRFNAAIDIVNGSCAVFSVDINQTCTNPVFIADVDAACPYLFQTPLNTSFYDCNNNPFNSTITNAVTDCINQGLALEQTCSLPMGAVISGIFVGGLLLAKGVSICCDKLPSVSNLSTRFFKSPMEQREASPLVSVVTRGIN